MSGRNRAATRWVTPATCASALVVLLAAAGCGSDRSSSAAQTERGRAIFERSCSGCHTLTGHDTPARGGDLATAKLSVADIASFVRVMPVRLSSDQVAAVAAYVHGAAR